MCWFESYINYQHSYIAYPLGWYIESRMKQIIALKSQPLHVNIKLLQIFGIYFGTIY